MWLLIYWCISVSKKGEKKVEKKKKKSRVLTLLTRGPYSQSYGFSTSPVQIQELDHKASWVLKNCFQIMVLDKTLESLLNSKDQMS